MEIMNFFRDKIFINWMNQTAHENFTLKIFASQKIILTIHDKNILPQKSPIYVHGTTLWCSSSAFFLKVIHRIAPSYTS